MYRTIPIVVIVSVGFIVSSGSWADIAPQTGNPANQTLPQDWEKWYRTDSILHPTSPHGFHRFSSAVALDDDTLVVSAPYERTPAGRQAGTVSIWDRQGDTWSFVKTFQGSYAEGRLGLSLAISNDTIVAGAPGVAVSDGTNANCQGVHKPLVYVYERTGGLWSETAKLEAPGRCFGWSVAVHGDTIVAGDGRHTSAAYAFTRTDQGWVHEETITVDDDGLFGSPVHVNEQLGLLAVGALGAANSRVANGSVYVFDRSTEGWVQTARLRQPEQLEMETSVTLTTNCYSASLVMNEPGNVIAVADPCADRFLQGGVCIWTSHCGTEGVVHVYELVQGNWTMTGSLEPGDENAWTRYFGERLDMSGETIIVGNPWDDDTPGLVDAPAWHPCIDFSMCQGSAYVYKKVDGTWLQTDKITLEDGGGNSLGRSVAINGETLAVGAVPPQGSGIVHLYARSPFEIP